MNKNRLNYIKNVLGIRTIMVPENLQPQSNSAVDIELRYQVMNSGNILFTSHYNDDEGSQFSIAEIQLIEKIIFALKLDIKKIDIAKHRGSLDAQKKYDYIFIFGEKNKSLLNIEKDFGKFRVFYTFGADQMIENPELKKAAWTGFQKIMEKLPR